MIKYCDGTGHQGYRSNPIQVNGKNLYIKGENNTKFSFEFILKMTPPESLDTFILTGCSAGGLATFTWADYVQDLLTKRNPKILYFAMPDSGFFVDYKSYKTYDNNYAIGMQAMF